MPTPLPSKSLLYKATLWLVRTPLQVYTHVMVGEGETEGTQVGTILEACDSEITPAPPAALDPPVAGTSSD